MNMETKITDLAKWPHLGAAGKGRVVRGDDGVIVGYVKSHATGRARIGSAYPGGPRTEYSYSGIDGKHFIRSTLIEIKRELSDLMICA